MHAAGSPTNAIGSIRSMRGTSLSSSSLVATPRGRRNLQVVAGKKGKQSGRVMPGRMTGPQKQMSLPPLDPEDPQFVLFVRSKRLPQWFPFSVVSGGSQAKLLTKAMENDLGKKMYANTLTKNIAGVVYKDISNIKQAVYAQYPRLKEAKELEFGYKIRKEESLQGTFGASGIVAIPPQEELKGVVDKVKDFFSGLS